MILQALSSLISHRVPVNLDPLFPDLVAQPEKQLLQTINLGGIPIQQIFAKGIEGLHLRTDEQTETYLKPRPVSAPIHAGARSLSYIDESEIKRPSSEYLMHSQHLMEPIWDSTANGLPALSISSITGFPGEFGSRRNLSLIHI